MKSHRHPTTLLLCILLAAAVSAPAQSPAESSKLWHVKPDKGFIDDAMAFDTAEERFAYIHTDSAQFLNIIVLNTGGFAKIAEIAQNDSSMVPRELAFTEDGQRLIFVWQDSKRGALFAHLIDIAKGKTLKKVGPADQIQLVRHGERTVLALTTKRVGRGGAATVMVAAYLPQYLKLIRRGQQQIKGDGTLARPKARLLYWEPGHLSLMGMMKGGYDKKRDVRLPEKGVRYDILTRKTLWSQEPQDLMQWAKATNMRGDHPGQLRFLQVSDDLKRLHLVSPVNELSEVSTPVKWSLYEPKSLEQRESVDGQTLHFSMTVDPVNPAAVKRKKADKERMDLYRLGASAAPKLLGQVLTKKRGFAWRAGQRFFAYLEKLKGFSRGGKEIRIYRVTP